MKRNMKKKLESITATMAPLIHMHGIVLPMRLFMPTISQQALLRPILLMPVLITEITKIFVNEIRTLKSEADLLMAALPINKRTVVTPHDAFGYFADLYNLRFEAPQGLSTESEASAADVAKLIMLIRKQEISAVFIESITDNRLMQQIANETGAVIGGKLYSDALSNEDEPASTYLDMMRHNTETLSQALVVEMTNLNPLLMQP